MHFIFVQLSALVLTVNKKEPYTCLSNFIWLGSEKKHTSHYIRYTLLVLHFCLQNKVLETILRDLGP